jgi:hypothetical protein
VIRLARAVITATAVAVLVATPVAAQTPDAPAPDPTALPARMVLAAQDPWVPVGGDTRLDLDITGAPGGASISVIAGQRLTGRRQFDGLARGGPIPAGGSVQLGVPLESLPVEPDGRRVLTLGLQSPTGARDPGRLNVRQAGVYPIDVELRDADEQPVTSLRTMLVVAEAGRDTVAQPLAVAWVWPVSAPPAFLPSGEPDRDVLATMRVDGRLGAMAVALGSVPDVPVTLAPTAETIEAWSEAAETDPSVAVTFDALLGATAGRAVLDGTYVPLDLAALLDRGLTTAVDDGLTRGSDVLAATLGADPDPRTRVLQNASPAAVARLGAQGVSRIVVPSDALAGPETRFSLAQPVTLAPPASPDPNAPVTALAADSDLQALLATDGPAAQRAQLVLAGLALIASEQPAVPRVATLVNPESFITDAALYEALLRGLRAHPYLRPVTTGEAFDTVAVDPPAPTVTASAATSEREVTTPLVAPTAVTDPEYRSQRARLNSFGALTRPGDPAVAEADRSLLASVATGWSADIGVARARAHLGVVDRVIGDLVARIEVPDPRAITLTSRSGEIPLTFRNETGHPIRLRASLSSDKLFFPQGTVLDLDLPPKSTTVRVAVEARTSGTFPIDLEVTSTDGVLAISQRRLEVRSTFVSTVGIVLMASAVGFLALWWGLDLRRRRRRRRSPTTA